MKILLTGASGFLGSWLLADLEGAGHEVYGPNRMKANLLSKSDVVREIKNFSPDCVVHAAGLVGGIQANIKNNFGFMLENLQIGANVVSAALECEVTKLINFSSSCVYPPNGPQPFKESQILTGALEPTNEGYAMAKLGVQKLVEFGARQYGVQFKTLIPSNLYGPKDNFKPESSHLLAAILYKIRSARLNNLESVEVWGDGSARREFTYVGDLSRWVSTEGLEKLASLPSELNVGCGHDYSVAEYYKAASKVLGYGGNLRFDASKPSGMQQKLMDSSIARTFGWNPATDLLEGIRLTTNWMENNVK